MLSESPYIIIMTSNETAGHSGSYQTAKGIVGHSKMVVLLLFVYTQTINYNYYNII